MLFSEVMFCSTWSRHVHRERWPFRRKHCAEESETWTYFQHLGISLWNKNAHHVASVLVLLPSVAEEIVFYINLPQRVKRLVWRRAKAQVSFLLSVLAESLELDLAYWHEKQNGMYDGLGLEMHIYPPVMNSYAVLIFRLRSLRHGLFVWFP